MNKKLVLACDFRNSGGEGVLAREYIKNLSKDKSDIIFKVISPSLITKVFSGNIIDEKKTNDHVNYKSFYHKYLLPIIYIFKTNIKFRKEKVIYLNYLPLWNFLIFLFKSKNTELGLVVSTENNIKLNFSMNNLLRIILLPLLEKISIFIIKQRGISNLTCATPISYQKLKNSNIIVRDGFFLPNIDLSQIAKTKKKYNFCIYFRNHPTRYPSETISIINKLADKYKIAVIGEFYNDLSNDNIFVFNNLDRYQSLNILNISSTFINIGDNGYSLMSREAIVLGINLIVFSPSINIEEHANYLKYNYGAKIRNISQVLNINSIDK